jgi:putative phosphoesterase
LIFSDSHGKFERMKLAVLKERPNLIIHLGDGAFDLRRLKGEFPEIPTLGVRGNCDIGLNEDSSRTVTLEGVKILMTHGHIYGVKQGYATAIEAAKNAGADLLLFGHTHRAEYMMAAGLHLLNPGSIMSGEYAVAELKDGRLSCKLETI